MKQLKLFLTLLALTMGWSNVGAQTDVTSTYITNADFSSTEGWTVNKSTDYSDIGNGLIGDYTVRFSPATADETHLATEYCFGFECRWQTNFSSYNQTTDELLVGTYLLSFDVENVNSATTSANYDDLFFVRVGETKYTSSQTEWMKGKSNWTTHTISFTISEPTAITISLGYGTGSNNIEAANTPALYVSHLKLTYTDPAAAANAAKLEAVKYTLNGYIKKATALNGVLADEALTNAISAAQTTYDASTDYDTHYTTVITATETLAAAIDTATESLTAVTLSNGNFDTAPNNTLNADGTTTFGGTLSTATTNPDNTKDMSANTGDHGYLYDVAGWTQYSKFNSTASQGTTSEYGTAMPANGWSTNSTTIPATDMFGASNGAALHLSAGWNDQARYMQTINNLPQGRYIFYYEVINQHSNTGIASNYIGVNASSGDFYGTTNSFVYSDLKSIEQGVWKAQAFEFDVAKESNINFNVGVTTSSSGSGNGAKLWIDNVLVYRIGDITMTEEQSNAILAEVAELDGVAFYTEKKVALATAKAAFEANQTLDNYNALSEALLAAKESAQHYEYLDDAIKNIEAWTAHKETVTDPIRAKFNNGEYNDEEFFPIHIYEAYQPAEIAAIVEAGGTDFTSVIFNHSFETGDLSLWNANERNDTGVMPNSNGTYTTSGVDGDYLFNSWGGTAENNVYQTIPNMPAGTYQLSALLAGFTGEELVLTANNTSNTIVVPGDKTIGYTVNVVFTLDEAGDILIKASNKKSQSTSDASFIKADNFTLKAYSDPLAALKEQLATLQEEATTTLADEAYVNVTGLEKTTLEALLATTPEETEEAYNTAISDITAAITAFKVAKTDYDTFLNIRQTETPDLPYASEEKRTALTEAKNADDAISAEDANAKSNAIISALRAYYESNAMAEGVEGAIDMTDHITNPNNPTDTNGWTFTAGRMRIMTNEPYTNSDGSVATGYFDSNSWGTAFTTKFIQNVELEPGKYILTAKARGNGTITYQVIANDQATDIGNPGNTGGVFGRGWGDYTVEFEIGDEQNSATIGINVETDYSSNWISFGNFRLVQLSKTEVILAEEADYTALADAIAAAESKKLGFDAEEYAPYENVAALEALAAAQAIDVTAPNRKDKVEAATATLNAAAWTANTEEVNCIYDGQFANTEANTTSGDINLPGWRKNDGIRLLVKDVATDPGLAYTDGKAALFLWGGTMLAYGSQTGYTLPMNAGEIYELTFKVAGWRDGDLPTYIKVALDGVEQQKDITVSRINDAEGNLFAEVSFYVKPEYDSSFFFIITNKHFAIADLKLVHAPVIPGDVNGDQEVNIADVTALVNALQKGEQPAAGDLDGVEGVTGDDVKALVELILHNE